jgi:predicted GIY-YIG superfamily endonuclease
MASHLRSNVLSESMAGPQGLPEGRLVKHCEGSACVFTARRRPVALVYSELQETRAAALRRERQLKKWTRAKKEALIARSSSDGADFGEPCLAAPPCGRARDNGCARRRAAGDGPGERGEADVRRLRRDRPGQPLRPGRDERRVLLQRGSVEFGECSAVRERRHPATHSV